MEEYSYLNQVGVITSVTSSQHNILDKSSSEGFNIAKISELQDKSSEQTTVSPNLREDRFEDIMASWGSMRADITWIADNIIYGMFLPGEAVLNRQETTLMLYSAMACMGLLETAPALDWSCESWRE